MEISPSYTVDKRQDGPRVGPDEEKNSCLASNWASVPDIQLVA
jgi:hypothetical protein